MANSPFWVEVGRNAVQVSGPDALTYLQGQISQELRPLGVGASRWTLLLQPNGRVDVLARVWRTDDETYVLDTDAGFGDELLARINRFKIRVKADVEPLEWRCLAVRGTDGSAIPDGIVVGWWDRDFDVLGPVPEPPDGIRAGSAAELEEARVEAGWPAMGAEIVPGERIPAEIGVVPVAVDFKKGCYPGQELVERMDSRGADAPRHLRVLTVAEGAEVGDPVLDSGQHTVGVLTSVCGNRALGYVKRGADIGTPPPYLGAILRDT
jgi:tRNA-modifying protein YgfZ